MSREIPLSNGMVALVDDEDYERVAALKWMAERRHNIWYARHESRGRKNRIRVYLHRFILGENAGARVDHQNRNGLDCQKLNLRQCTHSQNMANSRHRQNRTAPYRGVSQQKSGRWAVEIWSNRKRAYCGTFDTPEEAARVYDRAAIAAHGDFATLNFPGDRE